MEYLGFWVTRDGVRPLDKNAEEIRIFKFIGVVKYYPDMWEIWLHTL